MTASKPDLKPEVSYVTVQKPQRRPWKVPLIAGLLILVVTGVVLGAVYGQNPLKSVFRMASSQRAVLDDRLPTAIDSFARALHQKLATTADNVFFSPLSVSVALSMTLLGAREETRSQLAEVLSVAPLEDPQISGSYSALFQKYKNESSLHSANLLYTSDDMVVKSAFQQTVTSRFFASIEAVNFKEKAEQVRENINQEVEKQTNNKISDLIPPGGLDRMTQVVLVNAVHFKGTWKRQFDPSKTRDRTFRLADGGTTKVPMMTTKAKFLVGYHDNIKARSLVMDYADSSFSMAILLPDSPSDLPSVEKQLSSLPLSHIFTAGRETELSLSLPKFSLTYEQDLKNHIGELGAPKLVSPNEADLSGIAGRAGDMHVSNIFHKAFIEVNEEGAEAAAATAVVVMLRMAAMDPQFVVDRPFLFFLFDRDTKIPVFAGRYSRPAEAAPKAEL